MKINFKLLYLDEVGYALKFRIIVLSNYWGGNHG